MFLKRSRAIFKTIYGKAEKLSAALREEIDLQVDMLTERELTKLMQLVCAIAEKQGIDLSQDEELQTMLEPTSVGKIEQALEGQVLGTKQPTKENAQNIEES